ncbi:MAG: hypothetical protein M9890_08920 [Thermomicrobiales bacterium]|nr:hypothetical protein [Thermomicrobiales bacterium]
MSDQSSDRVIVAAVAPSEIVAQLWKQVLEDEGIIVALRARGLGHTYTPALLAEHDILVRADQAERARTILSELAEEDSSDPSES